MVAPNGSPRVQLVAKPGSPATGIGRYAMGLERGLRADGLDLILRDLEPRQLGDVQHVLSRDGHETPILERGRAPGWGPSTALELFWTR